MTDFQNAFNAVTTIPAEHKHCSTEFNDLAGPPTPLPPTKRLRMQTAGKDRTVALVTIPASSKPPCGLVHKLLETKFVKTLEKT